VIKPEDKTAKENMLVTQSNQLVEAKYYLSLAEQRLVLMLASMVEPDDKDFKSYVIKISDFKDLIGLKSNNLYGRVKLLLRSLASRVIEIPKEGRSYLITGWISDAEYFDNEGIVKLSFSSKLKPYLIALKSEFTSHKLGIAIRFKGAYTIRIYTLLKQYQRIGTRTFTLEEFREILGIEVDKLLLFSNLKARTIIQAQKEFSRKDENGAYFSDINFTFEAIKTGRKVTGLKFNIFSQNTRPAPVPSIDLISQEQGGQEKNETYLKLVNIGIAKVKADKYLSQYGAEYLESKINLLMEGLETGQVKNPAGYLTKAILEDWTSEKVAEKRLKEAQKEKEEQARLEELTKELREKQIKKLSDEFAEQARTEFLSTLSEEEKEDLLEEVKAKYTFMSHQITSLDHGMAKAYLTEKIPNYQERKEKYINENLKI